MQGPLEGGRGRLKTCWEAVGKYARPTERPATKTKGPPDDTGRPIWRGEPMCEARPRWGAEYTGSRRVARSRRAVCAMRESLRFGVCALAGCRQMYFLCTRCDRGQRYCTRPCSAAARKASLRRAGAKYQATPQGRSNHAARQQRHLAAVEEKMTHQAPEEVAVAATVSSTSATSTMEVELPGATRTWSDEVEPGTKQCCGCGRPGRFYREATLARCRSRWPGRRPA